MNRFARLLGTALVLAVGIFQTTSPAAEPDRPAAKTRDIDLVICLDCSNSMDGLIDSAKARLWDIVNDFAKIKKPAPNLRVALYSYGNDGYEATVGWVRKELDFTTDLDLVSEKLFALKTNGGTEYVTRVCRDAVRDLKWSRHNDALKVIYVCGNEPASQDRVVSIKEVAKFAISKGIYINPIFCGSADDRDAADWRDLARLAGGEFATINQDGAKAVIATPMDKKIADLGVELNATYVRYGEAGKDKLANRVMQQSNAYGWSVSSAASCTTYQCSPLCKTADWDLVDRVKNDPTFDIAKVPSEQLCEKMRVMTVPQRVAHVKEMTAKRAALQKQIAELSAPRDAFIAEAARRQTDGQPELQRAIINSLRKQAEVKGFCY